MEWEEEEYILNERGRKALRGSIESWTHTVEVDPTENHTAAQCPLCSIFYGEAANIDNRCEGCPISAYTGRTVCEGTPYVRWCDVETTDGDGDICDAATLELKKAAQVEVNFLKMLYKKYTGEEYKKEEQCKSE